MVRRRSGTELRNRRQNRKPDAAGRRPDSEFLQASAQVLSRRPNVYFFVAGIDHSQGNRNRLALERLIGELKLTEHVRLVGWLEDLAQLYCALDVFVSASYTESFGLAIVEAMASSAPIVVTETEGAREIIQAGETGLLVPIGEVDKLAEAVLQLLENKDRRVSLGVAAQQSVARRFSVERMIDETEEIYQAETNKI